MSKPTNLSSVFGGCAGLLGDSLGFILIVGGMMNPLNWVIVKIMVPFWVPSIYLVPYCNRDPKRDHNFDNHSNLKP